MQTLIIFPVDLSHQDSWDDTDENHQSDVEEWPLLESHGLRIQNWLWVQEWHHVISGQGTFQVRSWRIYWWSTGVPWCAILYSLELMFRDVQFSCSTTSGFGAQQWFWDYFRLLFGCRDDGIQTLLSKRHLLTYWYLVLSVILDWRRIYGRMVIYRF